MAAYTNAPWGDDFIRTWKEFLSGMIEKYGSSRVNDAVMGAIRSEKFLSVEALERNVPSGTETTARKRCRNCIDTCGFLYIEWRDEQSGNLVKGVKPCDHQGAA